MSELSMLPDDVARELADVCSLPEPELRERAQRIRTEVLPHVTRQERQERGVSFFFEATPGRRAQLAELVALERECCGPTAFELHEGAGELRLEVRVPEPSPAQSGLGLRSLVRSAGLGAALSFVVLCVVLLGLTALLGAGAVAPLLGLDDPKWVVGGAVVVTGGLLLWERQRAAGRRNSGRC